MANQSALSYYDTLKIDEIFSQHGWPKDAVNKSSLYKRFIRTYEQLSVEERDLFIKLSRLYKWVSLSEYSDLVVQLLEKAITKYYNIKAQDIWVYPIKKAEHCGVIKSADVVSYLCNAMQTQYSDQLYKRKVHVIGSLSELCTKKSKFKDRPLLIFDDFVGSGKYASEVLDELVSTGIPATNVVICSLFISELGLQQLSSKDCHIEYIEVAQSIIDKLPEKEKDLLKHIETSLGVEEDFKFGYGHSANLISLLRTPNNSLPIFWLDKGRSHSAPFPR
ncbi:phosphoribosyltransferase-like protein [Flavonifractor plautii]|uniref:PRTase-CE domain-containing protein n=1 Tax=Flavonifractor plautii 1_3_50AFAA TaxID=742738 RepID=A0A096AYX4_FLAPL|nr:hypothetical protein [Flavonifractor plautii]KGF51926.1 hypothetical protein HMPREF9460_04194 [Flavonifractor plautii 1_3_50AFAA]MCB7044060.1 hypothetical protein [Flavonifractor plautii]MCG4706811.1 hypothetical protein [Flavonifractor plautii]MDB7869346.1 hypothetical protein [Flavonifractor plautii]MDB7873496.1 hypothetical protein [Flavonifractor plautii]